MIPTARMIAALVVEFHGPEDSNLQVPGTQYRLRREGAGIEEIELEGFCLADRNNLLSEL